MMIYQEAGYRRVGVMLLVRTLLILLCFVSVSQAQLQNFLTALTTSDSGATIMGNPSGNTSTKSVLFHFATVVDSIMSSLQNYGKQAGNYASLASAVTDAVGDTATLVISERHAITVSDTLTGMAAIVVNRGGYFNVNSGKTLTFDVPFYAGSYRIFEGSGNVRFLDGSVREVYPEWWGNTGAALDSASFTAAADTATLVVSKRYAITANTTFSGLTDVIVRQGGKFNISSGVTLTFADSVGFYAGDYQVFEGSGSVNGLKMANPVWWGAVGDGVVIDSTAFKQAMISLNTGGIYHIPKGNYILYAFVLNTLSNVIVEGEGVGVTRLKRSHQAGGNRGVIRIDADSSVVIRDLEIYGDPANNQGYREFEAAIAIKNSHRIWIYNTYLHHMGGDGIDIADIGATKDIFISNNVIDIPNVTSSPDTLVGRNAISVTGGENIWIVNNNIEDGGTPGGIDIEPTAPDSVDGVFIIGNRITSQGAVSIGIGIQISDAAATPVKRAIIQNNIVSNYSYGLRTTNPDSTVLIKDNYFFRNQNDGILITGTSNAIIEGNHLHSNGGHGLLMSNAQIGNKIIRNYSYLNGLAGFIIDGGSGNEFRSIQLIGNIAYDNSQVTDNNRSGFEIDFADSLVMIGNISYMNTGLSNNQKWGFNFVNSDGVVFINNVAYNNKTAQINQSGNTNFVNFGNVDGFAGDMALSIPGNIGVGTTTPVAVFSVEKASSTDSVIYFSNNTVSSAFDSSMIMLPNGDVGIGTNAPSLKLHVKGTGIAVERAASSQDTDILFKNESGTTRWFFHFDGSSPEDLFIHPSASEFDLILQTNEASDVLGNVGIGTKTPGDKFVVVSNDTMAYGGFQTAAYVSSANQDAFWFDPGGDTLFVKNNGTVRYILTTAYLGSGH